MILYAIREQWAYDSKKEPEMDPFYDWLFFASTERCFQKLLLTFLLNLLSKRLRTWIELAATEIVWIKFSQEKEETGAINIAKTWIKFFNFFRLIA